MDDYREGYSVVTTQSLVSEYLPGSVVEIYGDADYYAEEEDVYADLLEEFVEATHSEWKISNIKQSHDEANKKYILSFKESGEPKKWACKDNGLSTGLIKSIVKRIEEQTSLRCVMEQDEDEIIVLCLPASVHDHLFPNKLDKAA